MIALALGVASGHAQHGQAAGAHSPHGPTVDLAAHVVPVLTRATPTAGPRSLSEAYLSQPIVSGQVTVLNGGISALAMLNLEGLTLARGELNTGTYGEGYVDRRHPHSYIHEFVTTALANLAVGGRPVGLSLTGGRGFAPFGSDDPMTRPFVKYPVNHHLAQILERVVVVLAARSGPLVLEAGVFNGDEPTNPRSVPNWSRFGDSWSARATLRPAAWIEIAGSAARVESPEFREALGLDQRKTSAVLRFERQRPSDGGRYLLVEWARTSDYRRERLAFTYTSYLAEAAYCGRPGWGALRVERTIRPEEERLIDPFRTPRPEIDFAILGRTRWTAVTAAAGTRATRLGVVTVAPFVEGTFARPTQLRELAAFVPRQFYGSERLWLLSAGARVNAGGQHHRMGRYGVAAIDHGPQSRLAFCD